MYTWGDNVKNLGRNPENRPHTWPSAVEAELKDIPKRSVVGLGETLLVQANEKVIGFGSNGKFSQLTEAPSVAADFVADADIDESFAVYLTKEGAVEVDLGGDDRVSLGINPETRAVACNRRDFFAVTSGAGGEKVFHLNKHALRDGSYELCLNEPVTREIHARKAGIAKLRAAGGSAAALLTNGSLLTWGSNSRGVVGHPRSELVIADHYFSNPQDPLALAGIKGKVKNFELSANVLVVQTEDDRVFFCGLENVFLLREVKLPQGLQASLIGCWEGHFVVVTKDNKIFSNADFKESPALCRRYDDLGLYRIDNAFFDGKKIEWLGGKYSNALAYCT